ncbi:CcdB family protein [Aquabacterium sp.]|uniref:CcdB family protein n=1 Tax=Aquabacterium sp. TaxID=1872578 RepID=UPI0019B7F45B|nr:CcdB family protein [Aquabacterium sp.]MBC7699670.1 CcdB family protein [Aquabacterium sp.]
MPRFCVHANPEGPGYLLDVQANLLSHLNTRMVVPLLPKTSAPAPAQTLNPTFEIGGVAHVMVTQFMAAVPQKLLQAQVLSLEDRAHEVVSALDCLFQGV